MSLIDADILDFSKVFIGNSRIAKDCRCGAQAYIDIQPRVDAVEVVRCKDCRHGKCVGIEYLCRAHSGSERKLGEDRHYSEWHDGNWFCADGERKEVSE